MEVPSQLLLISLIILAAGIIASQSIQTILLKYYIEAYASIDLTINKILLSIFSSIRKAYKVGQETNDITTIEQLIVLNKNHFYEISSGSDNRYFLKVSSYVLGSKGFEEISLTYELPSEINGINIYYISQTKGKCIRILLRVQYDPLNKKITVELTPS
ncbi:MAG: hypothetical protein QXM43_00295 [Desulfurococcaceae archaeon]